jgi:hypothetical protein
MSKILAVAFSVLITVLIGAVTSLAYLRGQQTVTAPNAAPPAATNIPVAATPPPPPPSAPSSEAVVAPAPKASTKTVYAAPKAPARISLGSLGSKPCARLGAMGVSHSRMWQYYTDFGYPALMDIDHDGYPCETVYGDVN